MASMSHSALLSPDEFL